VAPFHPLLLSQAVVLHPLGFEVLVPLSWQASGSRDGLCSGFRGLHGPAGEAQGVVVRFFGEELEKEMGWKTLEASVARPRSRFLLAVSLCLLLSSLAAVGRALLRLRIYGRVLRAFCFVIR